MVEGAVGLMMRGLRWWMDGGLRSREGEGWGRWLYENTICNRPKKIAFRDTLALLTRKKALQWPQKLFAKPQLLENAV